MGRKFFTRAMKPVGFWTQAAAGGGSVAIAHDADSYTSVVGGTTSLTWAHTCTGSNLILLVGIYDYTAKSVTGVTYNGTALTLGNQTDYVGAVCFNYYYYWDTSAHGAVPTGAHNIVVSFTGTANLYAGGVSFTGVHQTTPFRGTFAANGGNDQYPTVTISSATGDMVVDFAVVDGEGSAATPGASQTQNFGVQAYQYEASSRKAGAASVTMSWTNGASNYWSTQAVSLKQANP
jgi:hypothetical protein